MARMKPQALLQQSKRKKGPAARLSVATVIACNSVVVLLMLSLLFIYRHKFKSIGGANSDSHLDAFERIGLRGITKREQINRIPHFAVLNTTKGLIGVELFSRTASKAVALFVKHSQDGYYNGLSFHRVIKHFMIQCGDPTRAGKREKWTEGGQLHDELKVGLNHEPFMLATSKSEQDAYGFELFITTTSIPDLDDKLTVFGRVVNGEDVVQEIEEVDTDEHFRPKSMVQINNIETHDEL